MDDLPVALDRTSRRPLADQLAGQLRDAAVRGYLRVGERLPSTRALARSLAVSRTVTAAAYEQLYAEGWISGQRGSGTYVAAVPPGLRRHRLPAHLDEDGDQPAFDLRPGSPWVAGIRTDAWRRAWRVAADVGADPRPMPAGTPRFRTAVAEHLLLHRGVLVEPASVLGTGGTTAALGELAHALLRPGDEVAVEEPGYPRAVDTLRSAGVIVRRAPVDREGLIVDRIPADVRAVYCTPAHQFPLGGRLSAARRVHLIEWARSRQAWVIEDDYDGELRYDVAPLPVLAALDPDVVIYLGTASKILSPTLGVGWLVAPPAVTRAVIDLRNRTSTRPSVAGQRVLTVFAESGDLARHFRRVRRELAARRELVVRTLTAAGLRVRGDQAGAHVVVPLANLAVERAVVRAAQEAGLAVDGLERCFNGPAHRHGLTVGYAAPTDQRRLSDALDVLAGRLGVAQVYSRGEE
ncbi:MAG TPA: PLP-dependent aminotransferase family protein [Jiangellales bacterium]|nr:PLP-dependent aminotransferase family protein [Jiangellales bacterium]